MKRGLNYSGFAVMSLVCLGALGWSAAAFAADSDGGESGGGGASICVINNKGYKNCNELLDVHMKRSRVNIKKRQAYQRIVAPVLQKLREAIPDFAEELAQGVQGKRWYISPAKIPELGPKVNGTDLSTKQVARQFQTSRQIWIDKNWLKKQGLEGEAGIIIHELAVNIFLKSNALKDDEPNYPSIDFEREQHHRSGGRRITMSDVRELVELLLTKPLPSPKELQKELYELNFGLYLTKEQKKELNAPELMRQFLEACNLPDDSNSLYTERLAGLGSVIDEIQEKAGRSSGPGGVFEEVTPEALAREAAVSALMTNLLRGSDFGPSSSRGASYGYSIVGGKKYLHRGEPGAWGGTQVDTACSYVRKKLQSSSVGVSINAKKGPMTDATRVPSSQPEPSAKVLGGK